MNLRLSSSASGTRNVPANGFGGGVLLRQQNVFGTPISTPTSNFYTPGIGTPAISTADYYHANGLYWFRCYDLNQCGATGQTIAASRGRYFWISSADHPSDVYSWRDGMDFLGGYSNRLGVFPDAMTKLARDRQSNKILRGGTEQWGMYGACWFFYNPDDGLFYLFAEGLAIGGTAVAPHTQAVQHENGVFQSSDLLTWTNLGPSHFNQVFGDWSSFQRVMRNGPNDYFSIGLSTASHNYGGFGKWTATTASGPYTQVSTGLTATVGLSSYDFSSTEDVTISSQKWLYSREDARNNDGGMYVSRVAVDANYNVLSSPPPVRLSNKYNGNYPGPTYVNAVNCYTESGIAHITVTHGMFSLEGSAGTQGNLPYIGDDNTDPYNGSGTHGPLRQQFVDYYTEIFDSSLAAQSSPIGVQASCASGAVTLTWMDALPNQTYRVYRGTSSATQATLISDVTGITATDSPTTDTQYWYKVVTLQSGVERGTTVVPVYCSANSSLTNQHINRVLLDGADPTTIDPAWIESVVSWLSSQNLTSSLMMWANPAFGTKKSGSTVQKIYCLGTTRLPRGGDYTPTTANTTYSSTGMNGTVPGWTNPNFTDRAYFGGGRLNNIRMKTQITVGAAYKKPDTNIGTFLAMNDNSTFVFQHTSGTPGNVSFLLKGSSTSATATSAVSSATAANIGIATFNGTSLIAYANGTAGAPQTGVEANTDLSLTTTLKGVQGTPGNVPVLVSGSAQSKYVVSTESFSFSNNEGKWSASDLFAFEISVTSSQAISLTTLLRNRIGP